MSEIRNIETLKPNPDNHHDVDERGKEMLLHDMSLGDHGTFLIIPDGMIINGNNRFKYRFDAQWQGKPVECRILTYGEDSEGYYAIIDGVTVKENEVIPHHYVSLEAMYKAYAFSSNGEAAYYDSDYIANNFHEWELPADKVKINFFPPKSVEETLKALAKKEAEKKFQLVIPCESQEDMVQKYQQILTLGITPKGKI
jgi:hypothetical protein